MKVKCESQTPPPQQNRRLLCCTQRAEKAEDQAQGKRVAERLDSHPTRSLAPRPRSVTWEEREPAAWQGGIKADALQNLESTGSPEASGVKQQLMPPS